MYIAVALFSLSTLIPRLWLRVRAAVLAPPTCVFYITGHGYGHAARSVVVIQALLVAGYRVQVVTSVPAAFFEQSLPGLRVHGRRLDSGAFQTDALNVDGWKSLDTYRRTIHDNHSSLVAAEIDFLAAVQPSLVVTDATPLACAAGKAVGTRVVILSNFCWDFIFNEMLDSLQSAAMREQFRPMIERVTADYEHADAMVLYPGYNHPMGTYRRALAPLTSRLARRSRNSVRAELGIRDGQRVLLLGFGGHSTAWKLQDSFLPTGWTCVVLSSKQSEMPSSRFIALASDIYAPDYVGAADVWVGKLGFGSVSEALAHAVPLVYIPRTSWPEERYLETYILEQGGGVPMPEQAFFGGEWGQYLNVALEKKRTLLPVDTRGSAQRIVRIIETA